MSGTRVWDDLVKKEEVKAQSCELFTTQDLISNFPYCLPNDSHNVSLENLVSDQLVIP